MMKTATANGSSASSASSSSSTSSSLFSFKSIFVTKDSYKYVASEFHPYHKHDINVLLHLFTTGLGVYGTIQLAIHFQLTNLVYAYAAIIGLTTPFFPTSVLHTLFVYACIQFPYC